MADKPAEEKAPEETSKPIGQESEQEQKEAFVPKFQSVADGLEDSEPTIEDAEDVEISDEEMDDIVDEVLGEKGEDDTSESSDEDDESDEDTTNKDGFQKGLQKVKNQRDQAIEEADSLKKENEELVKRLDSLDQRLNELTDKPEVKKEEKSDKDTLSNKDLEEAMKSFVEEGDFQGVMDVFDYKLEKMKKSLMKDYETAEQEKVRKAQEARVEWQTIVKEYSPEGYESPIFKSDPDYDIRNNKSALYVLADKIYTEGFAQNDTKYVYPGGMKVAVEEAFRQLVRKGKVSKSKGTPKEEDGLKNRLAKEQRKNAPLSGSSSADESTPSKKKPAKEDDLADYIAERKKHKKERTAAI